MTDVEVVTPQFGHYMKLASMLCALPGDLDHTSCNAKLGQGRQVGWPVAPSPLLPTISSGPAQTTPIFEPGLHYNLNYTTAKFPDCTNTHKICPQTVRHVNFFQNAQNLFCGSSCYSMYHQDNILMRHTQRHTN